MDTVLLASVLIGPVILMAMGAYLAIKPPKDASTRLTTTWVSAFVIVAGLTTVAGFYQSSRFEEKLTGGDGVFFFQAEPLHVGATSHTMLVVNTGKSQLYDGAVEFFRFVGDKKIERLGYFELPVIRPTSARTNLLFLPGHYKFEITARNGYWEQLLVLERSGHVTIQDITVMKRDGTILHKKSGVLVDAK